MFNLSLVNSVVLVSSNSVSRSSMNANHVEQIWCCYMYFSPDTMCSSFMVRRVFFFLTIIGIDLLINLKGNFFEPTVGSRPNFNRMCR